ncbi:MAG: hypothetical protein ACYTGX_02325 [Planctomycetota bacterium]
MSLEAHVLPLAAFLGGDFPSPVEKLCRGKGLSYFRVPRRAWGMERADAQAAAAQLWREGTGGEPPEWVADVDGRLGAGFHELLDEVALQRLQALAESAGVAAPHLQARPAEAWVVFPVEFDAPTVIALGAELGEFAALSAPLLARELEALRPRLGEVRPWEQVGEGELAAEGSDSLFAEKTVWSILAWLTKQSVALRLPVVVQRARLEG